MTNPKQLLDFLQLQHDNVPKRETKTLSLDEAEVLHALGSESLHIDDLANKISCSMEKLSALLIMMELEGLVTKTPSMVYSALTEWHY